MADDWSMAELVRRLDLLERLLRDLVSQEVYNTDQRHWERRITELERDLDQEREARKAADKELKERLDRRDTESGTSVRQAIYSGLIPGVLFLLSILITLSQARGK